jgi:hypothetical protein
LSEGAASPTEPVLKLTEVLPIRESPMAKCPNTRLTIPECSCERCLEEQIRRAAPALLEKDHAAPIVSDPAVTAPRANARAA